MMQTKPSCLHFFRRQLKLWQKKIGWATILKRRKWINQVFVSSSMRKFGCRVISSMWHFINATFCECDPLFLKLLQNVILTECHVDKTPSRWNDKVMKCHFDKMLWCQNAMLTKCHFDKMPCWKNVILTQCHVDKMPCW